ncbi:MAG: hypothetical protein ACERKN_09385 [Velocimicrobium sp.]
MPLSPADWAKSKVPVILTSDEEDCLRSHYTLDNENGIRNNIIIRLMLDLGLRSPAGKQMTSDSRYKVAVAPRILDSKYSDNNVI